MPTSIAELAGSFLRDAVRVEVTPETVTVERIAQTVMFVKKADKRRLLGQLIKTHNVGCGIVFTRTKHGANRLVKQLAQVGIEAAAIHGNKSQNARNRAMNGFRSGEIPSWWPPTSQAEGSTWMASPTSSILTSPMSLRATYTGSVGPLVLAKAGLRSPFVMRAKAPIYGISSG